MNKIKIIIDTKKKKNSHSFRHFLDARNTSDLGFSRPFSSKVGGAQYTRVRALHETLRYAWLETLSR